MLLAAHAHAADEPPPADPNATPASTPTPPITGQVDLTKDTKPAGAEDPTVGAIAFLGQFGKVAPPGPWMHIQVGYELLKFLMVYGEGELAFTDTSRREDPPKSRVFPLFGFGGGARLTIKFTDRFGVYLQGGLGAMKADIGNNALGILGFRDAESLGLYLGARLGVEWYQIDRHFALGLNGGLRTPQGFAKTGAGSDTPLAIDGGASIRYAF
jgi:hypothetical protein